MVARLIFCFKKYRSAARSPAYPELQELPAGLIANKLHDYNRDHTGELPGTIPVYELGIPSTPQRDRYIYMILARDLCFVWM